eukprot:3521410-Amphidinium_carterae.1
MSMLVNRLQGDVRSHLLLTSDLKTPNFDKASKTVEDYYRNVYIDTEFTAGTNAFEGKYSESKKKGNTERKDKINRSTNVYLVTTKRCHEQSTKTQMPPHQASS